ncbi:SIS domain-containing protein [Candidatus Poriferisocius sp.]|uniref:SIS domain-containing protein n=1 Tax=Candidatus Poriferisocius sp. TaxID=3101276 RepID=UPI003B024E13
MCGIVAVVQRRSRRVPPTSAEILGLLSPVVTCLRDLNGAGDRATRMEILAGDRATRMEIVAGDRATRMEIVAGDRATRMGMAAGNLTRANRLLRGTAGLGVLLSEKPTIRAMLNEIDGLITALEADFDRSVGNLATEVMNSILVQMKDAVWAISNDRLGTAEAVHSLAGPGAGEAALAAFNSVQIALSALDRLEVRGRDSAGLHILVSGHELDPAEPVVAAAMAERAGDPLFRTGSVRWADNNLSFVYKAAAEIGELGDNTAALRAAILGDDLLATALKNDGASATVIGHTRWASVGIINEANAHPLNSEVIGHPDRPYTIGALNGDVDNYSDLIAGHGLVINPGITTDAKIVPALWSAQMAGSDPSRAAEPNGPNSTTQTISNPAVEAFRRTVVDLSGSVAIAGQTAANPDQLLLALRGSGQALYIGGTEDAYVVASEPYGLVEQAGRYLRMDGETPSDPANPTASRGQVVILDCDHAGDLTSVQRISYDGTSLPITSAEIVDVEITTRDVDRRGFPHFLLKEISESPESFRKTLRGRITSPEDDRDPTVKLGSETLPDHLVQKLTTGRITDIIVIGQGTAAIAAHSLAHFLRQELPGRPISSVPATELSGFGMQPDMSNTLVIAISQSGTTTDTNRTVDLVRRRGAAVIAIVNRRNSDLGEKADGVLYTSDGRDVEMSVASTKAFYAQVAAGILLAIALADTIRGHRELDACHHDRRRLLLSGLRDLPAAMTGVLSLQDRIAAVVRRHALGRTHWAVVGNGLNRVASEEIRIKLSELCYRSIASDTTEDKKHIDLSSEPLILVCAAGLLDSTADDVSKEVAIFRAHKAVPIVITSDTGNRFDAASEVIAIPPVAAPELAFVLATMVGHLFGYEAALAIDELAQPLRETRRLIEARVAAANSGVTKVDSQQILVGLRSRFTPAAQQFFDDLRRGRYNGCLEAGTAAEVASMYRYALGMTPLDAYQLEQGRVGTPAVILEDLTTILTVAIGELTRPVDAIRHQAKTVTVGISRAEESLLEPPLVQATLNAGAPRHRLSYRTLRTLTSLDPAVAEITGFIRYGIDGDPEAGGSTIHVLDRGGITVGRASRTDRDPTLRGSKHLVATERQVRAVRGRADCRTIVLIPEVKDRRTTGITLLHVRFQTKLTPEVARQVLEGYRNRFAALHDEVTETEPDFCLDRLGDISTEDLLLEPVPELANRWRPEPEPTEDPPTKPTPELANRWRPEPS